MFPTCTGAIWHQCARTAFFPRFPGWAARTRMLARRAGGWCLRGRAGNLMLVPSVASSFAGMCVRHVCVCATCMCVCDMYVCVRHVCVRATVCAGLYTRVRAKNLILVSSDASSFAGVCEGHVCVRVTTCVRLYMYTGDCKESGVSAECCISVCRCVCACVCVCVCMCLVRVSVSLCVYLCVCRCQALHPHSQVCVCKCVCVRARARECVSEIKSSDKYICIRLQDGPRTHI